MPKKLRCFTVIFTIIFLATGCKDAAEKCGNEDWERYFALNGFSAATYGQYANGGIDAGNVYYSAGYSVSGGLAIFRYLIGIENVCAYQDPTFFSTLVLNVAAPNLSDTLIIKSKTGTKCTGLLLLRQAPCTMLTKSTRLLQRVILPICW